ncbi:MAG: pyridoxamine 5'-phosphate oxidase family protein [Chloroflexota bacterium]|nr:pyridoxamine 5'-phosphate oxidase family protein [Chloroflexota bacterium]
MTELRSAAERKADVLSALQQHRDGWLATASSGGIPHLIVVATVWSDEGILVATRIASRTARNLRKNRRGRLALGQGDDAIVIDLDLERTLPARDAGAVAAAFTRAAGWDPADEGADSCYLILRPTRIQAYRGYAELAGREVMHAGRWLA